MQSIDHLVNLPVQPLVAVICHLCKLFSMYMLTALCLWAQVEGMSSAELQQELLARGVDIQDLTKIELQDRLWAALQAEAGLLPPEDQQPGVGGLVVCTKVRFQFLSQFAWSSVEGTVRI